MDAGMFWSIWLLGLISGCAISFAAYAAFHSFRHNDVPEEQLSTTIVTPVPTPLYEVIDRSDAVVARMERERKEKARAAALGSGTDPNTARVAGHNVTFDVQAPR